AVVVVRGAEETRGDGRVEPALDGSRADVAKEAGRREALERIGQAFEIAGEHRGDLAASPALSAARDAREDLAEEEELAPIHLAGARARAAIAAALGRGRVAEILQDRPAQAGGRPRVVDHAAELPLVELAPALADGGIEGRRDPL